MKPRRICLDIHTHRSEITRSKELCIFNLTNWTFFLEWLSYSMPNLPSYLSLYLPTYLWKYIKISNILKATFKEQYSLDVGAQSHCLHWNFHSANHYLYDIGKPLNLWFSFLTCKIQLYSANRMVGGWKECLALNISYGYYYSYMLINLWLCYYFCASTPEFMRYSCPCHLHKNWVMQRTQELLQVFWTVWACRYQKGL